MRIATWNLNSLKARLERLALWLDRAAPDVLLMQETKLVDAEAPHAWFADRGYLLAHHGEGRWNGVAIASRAELGLTDIQANFGDPSRVPTRATTNDREPLAEARMLAATCGGLRIINIYAPNGRILNTPTYAAKLAWYAHLEEWLKTSCDLATTPLILGGDFNITPSDRDVWDKTKAHGGTHVSDEERAAFAGLLALGLTDSYRKHRDEVDQRDEVGRYTWWDYRAGDFFKNYGMRIDHLLLSAPVTGRMVWAEIDREARKGKPTPSDHAPYVLDLDEPGRPFDAGWSSAAERIAQRRLGKRTPD